MAVIEREVFEAFVGSATVVAHFNYFFCFVANIRFCFACIAVLARKCSVCVFAHTSYSHTHTHPDAPILSTNDVSYGVLLSNNRTDLYYPYYKNYRN